MKAKPVKSAAAASLSEAVEKALRRAGRRARETARRFGTKVYVSQDGKIVAQQP